MAGPALAAWTVSTVDTGGRDARGVAHAFDASGNPVIAYGVYKLTTPGSKTNYEVRYARQDAGTGDWTSEVVDSSRSDYIGNSLDMAFDPGDGNPTLSYGTSSLKVAHYSGTAWTITTVGVKSSGSWDTSIAFDPGDGGASVAYFGTIGSGKSAKSGLLYAHRSPSSGSWSVQAVDTRTSGGYMDLAFDGSGRPAIAYGAGGNAHYASWTGSSWAVQDLETGGSWSSLAFDPATGYPVVAHQQSLTIRVLSWDGSAWSADSFAGSNGSELPSIGFDGSGLLYLAWTRDEIDLAHRTTSGWVTEVIDSATWSNTWLNLVVDPNGNPSVSYIGNNASPYPRLVVDDGL